MAMVAIALGVVGNTLYQGWKLWRQQKRGPAIGALFLAAATITLPLMLALFGK